MNGYWFEDDGQYENSISGSSLGGGEGAGAALTLNWNPTDTLSMKTRIEFTDEEYDDLPRARYINDVTVTSPNNVPIVPGTTIDDVVNDGEDFVGFFTSTFGDASTPILPLTRGENPRSYCVPTGATSASGRPQFDCDLSRTPSDYEGTTQELFRISNVIDWDVEALEGTLSSLTGYIDSETHEEYDWDANAIRTSATDRSDALPGTHDIFNDDTVEIFSQEFRFKSDFEGPVNFTLGLQYWAQERVQREQGMLGGVDLNEDGDPATPPTPVGVERWQEDFFVAIEDGSNIRDPRKVEDDHKSIYAMVEWDINDQWKSTFEGRYTKEKFSQERSVVISGFSTFFLNLLDQDCSFTRTVLCLTPDIVPTLDFSGGGTAEPVPQTIFLEAEVKSEFFAPKWTLEWTPDDDSLWYFSIGKGIKPAGIDVLGGGGQPAQTPLNAFDLSTQGGFNQAVRAVKEAYLGERIFEEEEMLAYELGSKQTFSGGFGDVVFNSAVFFQDYTDKQVSVRTVNPATLLTTRQTINAGSAEVLGVELDARWATPIDGLSINANYTWLDTEYIDFEEFTSSENTIAKLGCIEGFDDPSSPTNPALSQCRVNRAGKELERAPEHALSINANYTRPLAGTNLEWFVEGDAQYQDERWADSENTSLFEDYTKVNLRLGLEADNWEAVLFVDNAFDDDTITSGSEIPDFSTELNFPAPSFITLGILPEERRVGIRAKYSF